MVCQSVIKKTCSQPVEMTLIYRYPAGSFGTIYKRITRGNPAKGETSPSQHDSPWRNPRGKKEMVIQTKIKEPRTMFPRSWQVQSWIRGGWLRNVSDDPHSRARITPISRSGGKGNGEFHSVLLFVVSTREKFDERNFTRD